MRSTVLAALAALPLSMPSLSAQACWSDRFDAAAELALLKDASASSLLSAPRRAVFQSIVDRLDPSRGRPEPITLSTRSDLRGEALALLGVDRVPAWPRQKADALGRASDIRAAAEATRLAREHWAAKRYDDAQATLDRAMQALGVHALYARC